MKTLTDATKSLKESLGTKSRFRLKSKNDQGKKSLTDGEKLAAVSMHYGLIESVESSRMKVICPFHGDKNPSLSLNFEEGFFYCFGCGVRGGPRELAVLAEKQNGNRNEMKAIAMYKKVVDGELSKSSIAFKVPREAPRTSLRTLYDQAYDNYHGLKKVSWMSPDCFEEYMARSYMIDRGFMPETLAKAGAKVTYRSNYQLMFPMLDNGKFKGWVCRTTKASIEKKRKYLYNKGFSRRDTLVGSYGEELLDGVESKYVIIVEGFMDRLKFVQFGVNNAVAILGWKMTSQQIAKLQEAGITLVISALDNDECGRKGSEFLKNHFDVVRWKYLKGLKDPGDMDCEQFSKMFRKTKQELRKRLERTSNERTSKQDQE